VLCFVVLCPAALAFKTSSPPKEDRAWKSYRNSQWGYCFSYPARWLKGEAFEGAGFVVSIGEKKFSGAVGEIDVTALLPAAAVGPRAETIDLGQDLQAHFDGLKRFVRAERVETLDQRRMNLLGSAALFTKTRYYDPQERATWLEELLLVNRNNALFRLELECRADHSDRFEPVFSRVIETFRFDCSRSR